MHANRPPEETPPASGEVMSGTFAGDPPVGAAGMALAESH
jgi:hypothetical protein